MKLYSADWCEPCHKVVKYVKKNKLNVDIINVDLKKRKNNYVVGEILPKNELIIPLLVDGKTRIRSAEDIIEYLKKMVKRRKGNKGRSSL